jgi:hypothetical protein
MQLPFKLSDVRMISIEGNKYRFTLANGFVEIVIDSLNAATRAPAAAPTPSRTNAKHIMFDDGIFGI